MKNFIFGTATLMLASLFGVAPVQAAEPVDVVASASVVTGQDVLTVSTKTSQGDENEPIQLPVTGAGTQAVDVGGLHGYAEYAPVGSGSGLNEVVALVLPGRTLITWVDGNHTTSVSNGEGEIAVKHDEDFIIDPFEDRDPSIDVYQIEQSVPSGNGLTVSEFAVLPVSAIQLNSVTAQAAALAAVTALPTSSTFRQNSFIPMANLEAPGTVCTPDLNHKYRFVGDNRSWSSADGAKYRTRMDVKVAWSTSPTLTFSKSVGETVREVQAASGTWVFESRATASNSSMKMTVSNRTSSYVSFALQQDVTNPMCMDIFTNGIAANTNVQMYRSGIVTGSISFLQMPNYELYFREDAGAWKTIKLLPLIDVSCLVPISGATCWTTVPIP